MSRFGKVIRSLIFFNEPKKTEEFVLKENNETNSEKTEKRSESNKDRGKQEKKREIIHAKPVGTEKYDNENKKSGEDKKGQAKKSDDRKNEKISKNLSENLKYMKEVYSIPQNGDIILREFVINVNNKPVEAFILFFDGMTDSKLINLNILQPLMLLSNLDIKSDRTDIAEYIKDHLLPQNQLKVADKYIEVIEEINFGGCGIFIDGIDVAFAADVKGWQHRGVERPNTELVIRGPQEGFTEVLRVNTALIRKIIKDEDLIAETITIGRRSKTACAMMYIKDIANEALVNEVRKRLKSIKIDYLIDSGQLEQLIEDNTYLPAPQIIETERPDRAASFLSEGKVVVIMHGSPFALAMPATLTELMHSPEDTYVRFPYGSFLRIIRIIGIVLSVLLPGLYVAITNYHHEMIPTDLLFAIEASREKVPFPSVVEILIMEMSFELIREAGIRIPGPIGPTLGIIGALILGQAAVAANIVSPILIIIVAVTGIGSFAIPNFSLGFSLRVIRFAYIFLGALAGFLGIALGMYIHGLMY
ncbi:MAG TPA: spore germination protein, partial [Clostridiaceae bacterium]|nr:spore germination protein [Clostridiaceae bacterium]